jgi:TonB family protein
LTLALLLCLAVQPMWAMEMGQKEEKSTTGVRLLKSGGKLDYPPGVSMNSVEGFVIVRFDVDIAGIANNIRTDDDEGFNVKIFGPTARNWVKAARFIPVTKNGVPVESKDLSLPVRFTSIATPGISREFRSELDKVVALVDAKDFSGAHHHAQWMLSEKTHLNYEYAVLESTLAHTLARTGELNAALEAARHVASPMRMNFDSYVIGGPLPKASEKDFFLPAAATGSLLKLQFQVATSLGLYGEAATAHAWLQSLGLVDQSDPSMATFQNLVANVQSAPRLDGIVKVGQSGIWRHKLLLRNFALRNIEGGEVQRLTVSCGSGRTQTTDYENPAEIAETIHSLPDDDSQCSLAIVATPGTQMHVIEYRYKP